MAAALDLASTMRLINDASFASRREVLSTMDMSLESSREELKRIQRTARDLRGEARAEFQTAVNDANAQRDALKESRKALKKANPENWESRKRDVGTGLERYSAAMARVDGIAKGSRQPDQN